MEAKPPKLMTPFDCLVTTDQLYTLKLLLPYTPPSAQRMLAVYVKFQEFRLALEYFQGFPPRAADRSPLEDLKPYLRPEERETMEQMEGMMHMMELMPGLNGQSMIIAIAVGSYAVATGPFDASGAQILAAYDAVYRPTEDERIKTFNSLIKVMAVILIYQSILAFAGFYKIELF